MSTSMRGVTLALICLASVSHGQRILPGTLEAADTTKALAVLLEAAHPGAAWQAAPTATRQASAKRIQQGGKPQSRSEIAMSTLVFKRKRGIEARTVKLVGNGEAATLEEAHRVQGSRAASVKCIWQKLVDSGEAATLDDAKRLQSARAANAAWQKLIDSGEAETLEEAKCVQSAQGRKAAWQRLVDSGQAASLEEAKHLQAVIAHTAQWQKLVDSGEAATIKEAQRLSAARAKDAMMQHMKQGGLVWRRVIDAAQRRGENRRLRPRNFPCPLGCGYTFTCRSHALRHAASKTACRCKF